MPGLLSLPIELVTSAFRQLACVELRRTLTVSRQWCSIAESVCYEDIILDFPVDYTGVDAQLKGIQRVPALQLKSLTLLLSPSLRHSPDDVICPTIRSLAGVVKAAKTLTHFNLHSSFETKTTSSLSKFATWTMTDFAHSLADLLISISTLKALRSVEIDVAQPGWHEVSRGRVHLCPMISEILLQVPRCRFRLPALCEEIFACQSTAKSVSGSGNVIINLSHSVGGTYITAKRSTQSCQALSSITQGTMALHPSIFIEAAQQALPKIPKIHNLRVIWHEYLSLDVFAQDCVTGRKVQISGHDWDESGEDVKELGEASDDDSFGSDVSSFGGSE